MRKMYLSILIVCLFIVQFAVIGVFLRTGLAPNLFVALAVSLVILFGFDKTFGWIIFAGLLMDIGSGGLIGSGTLVLILIAWLIDKIKVVAELRAKRYLFGIILAGLVLASSLIFDLLMQNILILEAKLSILHGPEIFFITNFDYAFKLFWSAIFGVFVYLIVRRSKTAIKAGYIVRR